MIIPKDDSILLKIHRQFSKDEAVAELLRRISALEFNNGELKSEVEELKHSNKQKKNEEKIIITKEMNKDEAVKKYKDDYNALNKKHMELNKKHNELVHKYAAAMFQIKNKPKPSFRVPHLIGNPVDAVDSFIHIAIRCIESGDYGVALKSLNDADNAVEEAKIQIQEFRYGKHDG